MRRREVLFPIATLVLTAGCIGPAFGGDCRVEGDLSGSIDTDGITRVEITAQAGRLEVFGGAPGSTITAEGRLCASKQSYADDASLEVTRRGDTAVIRVDLPKTSGWNANAYLDLRVDLPSDLPVEIDDSSGDLEVRDVGALTVRDSSGNIDIQRAASLEIEDGSGDIDIADIAGDVEIEDGSGNIDASQIGGVVRVDDNSGDIDVSRVSQVIVENDGSGNIDIRDVDRDVLVREDGSGDIRVRNAGGDVTVDRDGSGSIVTSDIGGRVSKPD